MEGGFRLRRGERREGACLHDCANDDMFKLRTRECVA
jgi:hypothetical protein